MCIGQRFPVNSMYGLKGFFYCIIHIVVRKCVCTCRPTQNTKNALKYTEMSMIFNQSLHQSPQACYTLEHNVQVILIVFILYSFNTENVT